MAAIEIEDLVVSRGGRTVLAGLTMQVAGGTITGLLGPSGSGKTTLMRCVVGVQVVRCGGVRVLGEPAGSAALRSRVGYVTQAPSVYADLTVLENARYFAALQGAGRRQAAQVVKDVGLAGHEDELAGSLSGGQHSRVSLACALVGAPEVLVLDEPTVGADPILREELWARFRELSDGGTTVLVSSHVMDEAGRCDRLLLVRAGEVIVDDTPAAIRERTGSDDLDRAFLTLIRDREAAA